MSKDSLHELHYGRILSFSDGVFAFAITLLVLKIDVPILPSGVSNLVLTQYLFSEWPQFVIYALTFLLVGNYWTVHHRMYSHIHRYDYKLLWMNIILLMFIAFLPFTTELYGDFVDNEAPFIIYAGTMATIGIIQAYIWHYATYKNRLVEGLTEKRKHLFLAKNLSIPFICIFAIVVSFLSPQIAPWLLLLIFLTRPIFIYVENKWGIKEGSIFPQSV